MREAPDKKAPSPQEEEDALHTASGGRRIFQGRDEEGESAHFDFDVPPHKGKVKVKEEYARRDVILSVDHLKVFFPMGRFPNRVYLKAVHDTNFKIHKGEVFGLVGESGCGKSTTGRSILRLNPITSGSIYYKGVRISAGERWNRKEIKWSRIKGKQKIRSIEKDPSLSAEEKRRQIRQIQDSIFQIHKEQKAKIRQIRYDNKHVDKRLMNEIQMIFQDPIDSLDPRMTVEDIIEEGLKIKKAGKVAEIKARRREREEALPLRKKISTIRRSSLSSQEKKSEERKVKEELKKLRRETRRKIKEGYDYHAIAIEALEEVGLIPDFCSRYPHEFSGGQRQRIGIARALVMEPELLICDEPISALDVSIRAQIINLLNELKEKRDLSILFIAHDLSVVKYFCDTIAVMYFGDMVELASSDELFKHPLHPYTKSLLSAIPRPDPLLERHRKRVKYDPKASHDYSEEKPTFQEVEPGHWVLANSQEMEGYRKEILGDGASDALFEAHDEPVEERGDEAFAQGEILAQASEEVAREALEEAFPSPGEEVVAIRPALPFDLKALWKHG